MLQRPHFLPNDKPSSVAQTAHCVRIILCMVKSLGGSPTMQKPAGDSAVFASALQPLANSCKEASRQDASAAIAFGAADDPWLELLPAHKGKDKAVQRIGRHRDSAAVSPTIRHPHSSFLNLFQALGPRPGARRRRKDPKKSSDKRLLLKPTPTPRRKKRPNKTSAKQAQHGKIK